MIRGTTAWRRWLPSPAMDSDRLTIMCSRSATTRQDSPEQEDARQDTHTAHLADLHQARTPAGCWPAARPHLTAPGSVHPFAGVEGSPCAQGTRSCSPGQQVPDHRFAVDGASRSDDLLTHHLPTVYPRACRNLITVLGQTAQGLTQAVRRTKGRLQPQHRLADPPE